MSLAGPKKKKLLIILLIILHRLEDLNNDTEELTEQQQQLEAVQPLADIVDAEGTLTEAEQIAWDAAEATQNSIEQSLQSGEWERAETEFLEMN